MSRLLAAVVATLLIGLTTGCGTDEGYTEIQVPQGAARVINAIVDSPPLIIEVGTAPAQQLDYSQSSPLSPSLPGLQQLLDVRYPNVNAESDTFVIQGQPLQVETDEELTVLLAGTLDAPQVIQIRNQPTSDIDLTTELELQFVNVATRSTGPVTVQLYLDSAIVAESALDFSASSPLVRVDAGDYRIEARDSSGTLLWDSGIFALAAGTRSIVMMADYFGPGSSNVRGLFVSTEGTVPFPNEELPAGLRIANLTATQGPLTINVRGETFAENIPFQSVTDYVELPSGQAAIQVTPFGEPDNILFEDDAFVLQAGTFLTLVTNGLDDQNAARLFGNDLRPIPVRARLRLLNASPTGGRMDFYVVNAGTSIDNQFPRLRLTSSPDSAAANVLALEEGGYDFSVTTEGTKDLRLGPIGITVMGGGIYSIYVTDAAGGGEPLEAVLVDDFTP